MSADKVDVVVVGGSLSGLFASVALESLDNVSTVTILERYQLEQLQDLGAGIRCNTEAIDAIREFMGVTPERYAAHTSAFQLLDRQGNIFMSRPTSGFTSSWGQLYRICRERFDASSKCSYRHGCTLTGLDELDTSTLKVEFTNAENEKEDILAHLVIGADGASSKARSLMLPEIERVSAGYVVYRGLVPEADLSLEAKKLYDEANTFSWPPEGQFVSYIIPGNEPPAEEAMEVVNWAWYQNKSDDQIRRLMTDKYGKVHNFSLPHGSMPTEEIETTHARARDELPPLHAEVVTKTSEPFVQVITDSLSTNNCFYNGKLLLVGDAVGGQRPHTASAILQCVFHGLLVRKLLEAEIDTDTWAKQTQSFSWVLCRAGKEFGKQLMTYDPRTPQEISADYLKLFMSTQVELNTMWKDVIGICGAEARL